MKAESGAALAVAAALLIATNDAQAQNPVVRFRNSMRTTATVRIVPVGGTTPAEFVIGPDNVVRFSFTGQNFDIRVIPRDAPNTGFRFLNIDLRQLAQDAVDGIVALDGAFGPSQQRLVCYPTRCGRCRCYWMVARGERTAVGLNANLRGGQRFSVESPKMSYENVMAGR